MTERKKGNEPRAFERLLRRIAMQHLVGRSGRSSYLRQGPVADAHWLAIFVRFNVKPRTSASSASPPNKCKPKCALAHGWQMPTTSVCGSALYTTRTLLSAGWSSFRETMSGSRIGSHEQRPASCGTLLQRTGCRITHRFASMRLSRLRQSDVALRFIVFTLMVTFFKCACRCCCCVLYPRVRREKIGTRDLV